MKIHIIILAIGLTSVMPFTSVAQTVASKPSTVEVSVDEAIRDFKWKIETEPAGIILNGVILQINRKVTPKLWLGLYTFSINIPDQMKVNMIDGLDPQADVRIGFELAIVARYKFWQIPGTNSGPYLGFTFGWEYFDIRKTGTETLRIETYVATPHAGFEYHLPLKNEFLSRFFINPSLRGVFYVNPTKSISTRTEVMKPFFLLPAVSVGFIF